MNSLFQFVFRYRNLFVFLVLEILASWLIFSKNPYQNAAFFNSSNQVAGAIFEAKSKATNFVGLIESNEKLQAENANLRKALVKLRTLKDFGSDKVITDSTILQKFEYIPAKVINKSVRKADNYLTINKGKVDSIRIGMGVIGTNGVVGLVKSVSKNYATAYSLLHRNLFISSKLKKTGDLCSVKWSGSSISESNLLYVPKHVNCALGDTIITSGYNQSFNEGINIGVISDIQQESNESFYVIKIKLAEDFNKVENVYIVKAINTIEMDSLANEEKKEI